MCEIKIIYPILGRPLLLLPPVPLSITVFSNESTLLMRWPKYWSFSFSIIPSKEIPGLLSLRMDWLDLLAVQGTLKSLLQHHSSKVKMTLTVVLSSTRRRRGTHNLLVLESQPLPHLHISVAEPFQVHAQTLRVSPFLSVCKGWG